MIKLLAFTVLAISMTQTTEAAELVIVEQEDCVYCRAFNRDIAEAYPNTAEGRRAPLRRINLDDPWPSDLSNIKPETLTPTFILVENNQEIGRLRGYPGDEYFWFLLGEMLEKLAQEN